MSESSNEKPETGLVSDEELPEDLRPDENPLARDPEDEPADADSADGADEPKVEGMPDAGS